MNFRLIVAAGACSLLASSALASLVTTAPGHTIDFPVANVFGPGPETLAPGITWSSTNASTQGGSVWGWNEGYGFGSNGSSSATLVGLNDDFATYGVTDTMTFSFATPVQAVGAVLNWDPEGADDVVIAVWDGATELESYTLYNNGTEFGTGDTYYGFEETTADITSFTLTDGYIAAIGGLNVGTPEPAAWALILAGFAGLGAVLRNRRRLLAL